jgi:hypothetical protein
MLQLDTECCSNGMRLLLVTAVRLCWSTTEVELVPYDSDNPSTTGCNTPGADADSILIYTDTGVSDPDYLPIVEDAVSCTAVVSWVARIEVRVTRQVQVQIEWKAVKGVVLPSGVSGVADVATYIHTNHLPYVVGCPAGQILTSSLECISVRPWTYIDTIVLISVVSGVIISILVVRVCIKRTVRDDGDDRRHTHRYRTRPAVRSIFVTSEFE